MDTGISASGLEGPGSAPFSTDPATRPWRSRRWLAARDGATEPTSRAAELELAERLDTLLALTERLAAAPDRRTVLSIVVDETRRLLGVDRVSLFLRRGDRLLLSARSGMPELEPATAAPPDIAEERVAEVMRTGQVAAWTDTGDQAADGSFQSDLSAPLVQNDRVIGALSAQATVRRAWSKADIAFVTTVASHAAIALAGVERLERSETRAAQIAVLQAASNRLNRVSTVEGVGRTVIEETRGIIEYHNARVYRIESPDDVVPIAFEGRIGAYELVDLDLLRCKVGQGFTGWVAAHGRSLLINDANTDSRGETIAGTEDIDESMLIVPMRYDGLTVGVITLSKLGTDGFDDEDLRLLEILADQAATALESARLLTRSQDLAGELRRLLEMSGDLSRSLDPRQVANIMAGHLAMAMRVDECGVSYWDRPGGRIESLGFFPPNEDLVPYFDVSGYPETLRVLDTQAMVIIDAEDPAADTAEVELMRPVGMRTLAMLPLVAKGQSIGLVELFSRGSVAWSPERLQLARTMANEAAMALENARLYEDARKLADRDPVTGFYNHRFLHERLGEEVVRAQRSRRPLSLLMLDLDDFKLVNDTFGHLFGDRVLAWTAERIRSTLRASDIAARYGGDEFALVLPDAGPAAARAAAARILEAFADHAFESETRGPVPVAVSIGVATFPTDARTGTELIAAADAALYRVKRAGGHDAADAASAGIEAA